MPLKKGRDAGITTCILFHIPANFVFKGNVQDITFEHETEKGIMSFSVAKRQFEPSPIIPRRNFDFQQYESILFKRFSFF